MPVEPIVPSFPQPISRRLFCSRLSAAAATGIAALASGCAGTSNRSAPERALVGTQLYGWGQYYQRANKNIADHMDEALSAIQDCGYEYAEGSLDMGEPENNSKFAEQLRAHRLRPVSLYTGGRLHDASAEQSVERLVAASKVARAAGFTILNCNPDSIGRDKTAPELETQARALNQLGTELARFGMALGIHHHAPEFSNHAREFHSGFQSTQPDRVGFCFDVHWAYRGGLAPMEALRSYGERVVSWHIRQSRQGHWWEDLDHGDIDYLEIAAFARKHQLQPYYTVELALEGATKITRSVVENHRRSREFIRSVFQG